MLYYGYPKIQNLTKNAKDFEKMGFKPGMFWGSMTAFLEFFGGIAMLLGILTPIVAAFFGLQMLVGTFWKLTRTNKPFSDYSYDILLFIISMVLITFGSGFYAIGSL